MFNNFLDLFLTVTVVVSFFAGVGYIYKVLVDKKKSKLLRVCIAVSFVVLVFWLQLSFKDGPEPPVKDSPAPPEGRTYLEGRCAEVDIRPYKESDSIECEASDHIDGKFQDYTYIGTVSGLRGKGTGIVKYPGGRVYRGPVASTLPNGVGEEIIGNNKRKVTYVHGTLQ